MKIEEQGEDLTKENVKQEIEEMSQFKVRLFISAEIGVRKKKSFFLNVFIFYFLGINQVQF